MVGGEEVLQPGVGLDRNFFMQGGYKPRFANARLAA
jgi:hypothetical protein